MRASLMVQTVGNLPAMQESRVWSLGWENPLEKETATHSSILAWEIPWTEEPDGLQSMELQRVRHNWETNTQGKMMSLEWTLILTAWCHYKKRTQACIKEDHMETHEKAAIFKPSLEERDLRGNQTCQHLDSRPPASRTVRSLISVV